MAARTNRRIVLVRRPSGVPAPSDFARDDVAIAEPGDGQFLVRNLLLSVDPAQRGWVNAGANYSDPVPIGGVMRSLAVGVVEQSRHSEIRVGEHLYGWFGWQDYCVGSGTHVLRKVDPRHGPLSTALGVLGITGISAYLALTEIGQPVSGETVLISTAAGAVGSIAGQLARRHGCHVVGLTGSPEKAARCVAEFGYDSAIDYRAGLGADLIHRHCPNGVDVFFDNTSGEIADAIWPVLNVRARIVQCGTAAVQAWDPPPTGPRRDREVLVKRLRHEGFIIFDHVERFPAVVEQLAQWLQDGSLRYREDLEQGLDRAPAALASLYRGQNDGKKVIRI
jgi:hypothetical protein